MRPLMQSSVLFLLALSSGLFTIPLWSETSLGMEPEITRARGKVKDWTLLVFLNGNNDLDSYGAMNINQMERVGSTEDLNVVVQWASYSRHKTERLYVTQDQDSENVSSVVLEDLGRSVDMGDWKSLVEFVRWGVKKFPARHYMIDIWDHGSGWHSIKSKSNRRTLSQISPMDISWDDFTGNSITTAQLGKAMKEAAELIGHPVDLYASDACLMAMIEVAQEMVGSVSVFAGSEEVEDGPGWPYDDILRRWVQKPHASASEVATFLTEEFVKSYDGGQYGHGDATYSAFDLEKMGALNTSLRRLGQQVIDLDSKGKAQVVRAAESSQKFTYADYVDLSDFLATVKTRSVFGTRSEDLIHPVQEALDQVIVAHAATSRFDHAYGASIWIPTSESTYQQYKGLYEKLKFHAETGWSKVLGSLFRN